MHQLPVKPVATHRYIKVVQEYILHEEIKKVNLSPELKFRLQLLVAKEMDSEMTLLRLIKEARSHGILNEEINHLLIDDVSLSPTKDQASLTFAMHFASTHGEVEEDRYIDYVHQVGCSKACAVSKYLKGLIIVSTRNNALNALKQRMAGQPMSKSSVAQELGVITAGLWVYPKAYAKKVWLQTKR